MSEKRETDDTRSMAMVIKCSRRYFASRVEQVLTMAVVSSVSLSN